MHHIDEADETIRDVRLSETTDSSAGNDQREHLALILSNAVTMPAGLPEDVGQKAERLISAMVAYLNSDGSEAALVKLQSPGRIARKFRECVDAIEQSAEVTDREHTLATFRALINDLWSRACKGDQHLWQQLFPKDSSQAAAK